MADQEKGEETEIQKIEYLENGEGFLGEIQSIFQNGLSLVDSPLITDTIQVLKALFGILTFSCWRVDVNSCFSFSKFFRSFNFSDSTDSLYSSNLNE